MKLTDEQKQKFKDHGRDWEAVHGLYDLLMRDRLEQLDPDFFADLEEATKDATFWYA